MVPTLLLALALAGQEPASPEAPAASGDPPAVDAPAVTESEPQPPADAPAVVSAPAGTPAPKPEAKRPVRIAVQQVTSTNLSPRLAPLFTASLVTELRKLNGVSVIGMDEVRALLEIESQKQAAGCDEASCLNELAEALGADIVVTASLAELDGAHLASFRRLDAGDGKTAGVDKRFDGGNGEELLSAIGPAVEEMFPHTPLRDGAERGVDKEVAYRLNPPPIAPWMTIAVGGGAAALLLAGVSAGLMSALLTNSVQARIDDSIEHPADGATLKRDFDTAQVAAGVANGLFIAGAAAGVGGGAMAFFTDWWGYGAE